MHHQRSPLTPYRFTTGDYHRMAETGILGPDARVELLDGEIVERSPIGPRHSSVVDRITRWICAAVGDAAICRVQSPVRLADDSEPEPDVALLRPRPDFYAAGHPAPADVLLLIEVAETSRETDLDVKRRLYARAGIAEYWVIDIDQRVVVVHRRPADDRYSDVTALQPADRLIPPGIDETAALPIIDLFRYLP